MDNFHLSEKNPEDRVKYFQKLHYERIDKALKADESQDFETAIQYYIKGLEFSNLCLKEKIVGNTQNQIKARQVQEKIKKNREAELDRLEYLLANKLSQKQNPKLKKASSLEMDDSDFAKPKALSKSVRGKKMSIGSKSKDNKSNHSHKNQSMGERSHSATCLNKIQLGDCNLARALDNIPSTNKTGVPPTNTDIPPGKYNKSIPTPTNQSGASQRYTSASSRYVPPPRPKLSQSISDNTNDQQNSRKIDQGSIMSKLKNVDKQCVETILNEVLDSKVITFEDVAGNDSAKQCLMETVIYPRLRPELFTGLRSPAKGILLFGPPGNGKTLLAKAVANESKCVFFNISAASLMSKWVGEGEKMVRALFATARVVAPAVIFLDEVDSLLSARNSDDKSVTRRMLTQFLQEIDGAASDGDDNVLVMAATNRPDELDDAALRRFQKKIYIKMPDNATRKIMIKSLLTKHSNKLKDSDIDKLIELTKGYSSSDLTNLAKSAAMIPIRELSFDQICSVTADSMRQIKFSDFTAALKQIKPSVPLQSLARYEKWNNQYGDNS